MAAVWWGPVLEKQIQVSEKILCLIPSWCGDCIYSWWFLVYLGIFWYEKHSAMSPSKKIPLKWDHDPGSCWELWIKRFFWGGVNRLLLGDNEMVVLKKLVKPWTLVQPLGVGFQWNSGSWSFTTGEAPFMKHRHSPVFGQSWCTRELGCWSSGRLLVQLLTCCLLADGQRFGEGSEQSGK